MASGGYYRVLVKGVCLARPTLSVWWYQQSLGTGGAAELAQGFMDALFELLLDTMCADSGLNNVSVYNHNDPEDFVENVGTGGGGSIGSESLPSSSAVYVQCARGRQDIRSGRKMLYGIPENQVSGNQLPTSGTYKDALVALTTAMGEEIVEGGNTYIPVIVRRVKVTVGGKTYYRVPTTITVNDTYPAVNWNAKRNISTQNSRKVRSSQTV